MDYIDLANKVVVPEPIIRMMAINMHKEMQSPFPNIFDMVLTDGLEYKKAGLTPLYLSDEQCINYCVTSVEAVNGAYH